MDIPNSDTVHTFTLDNLSFGDLSKEEVYECMKDGRLASHFLERQLTKWFPALTRVDQKGHDHVDTDETDLITGLQVLAKTIQQLQIL
jgi:hypothetical protein